MCRFQVLNLEWVGDVEMDLHSMAVHVAFVSKKIFNVSWLLLLLLLNFTIRMFLPDRSVLLENGFNNSKNHVRCLFNSHSSIFFPTSRTAPQMCNWVLELGNGSKILGSRSIINSIFFITYALAGPPFLHFPSPLPPAIWNWMYRAEKWAIYVRGSQDSKPNPNLCYQLRPSLHVGGM